MKKVGLVCQGGSYRCAFTGGVLKAFEEASISFPLAVGVSAGSLAIANYLAKQSERSYLVNYSNCTNPKYTGKINFLKTGDFINFDYMFGKEVISMYPFNYEELFSSKTKFYAVSTCLENGRACYTNILKDKDNLVRNLKASCSLPLLMSVMEIDGYHYVDGGVADPIPVKFVLEDLGFSKAVVICTRDASFRKKNPYHLPLLAKTKFAKYVDFTKILKKSHKINNDTEEYLLKKEKEGKVLIIRPEVPVLVGRIEKDKDKIKDLYDIGLEIGRKHIKEVEEFLKD